MSNEITIHQPSAIEVAERQFSLFQRQATALANSDLLPKEYKGNFANCLIAIEIANRIGANALMVSQNLAIIHGRPSWSSTFIISAINSSGKFKPLRFKITEKPLEKFEYEIFETTWVNREKQTKVIKKAAEIADKICIAWTTDKDGEVLESPPVSLKMALQEGWYDKSGSKWKTMPDLMLRYRAAAFFGRLYAPDILMGMKTDDEVVDMIDVTPVAEPKAVENELNDIIAKSVENPPAPQPDPKPAPVIIPPAAQEVKPMEPKHQLIKDFDLSLYDLEDPVKTGEAADEMHKALSEMPVEQRQAAFGARYGDDLIFALKKHGKSISVNRFAQIGIRI